MEIVLAVSISIIVIVSTSAVFSRFYSTYRNTKGIQRNLESAQFALNLMAKTIRTSSAIDFSSNTLRIYTYSDGGKCIGYRVSGGRLQSSVSSLPAGETDYKVWCSAEDLSSGYSDVSGANVNSLQFYVVPSDPDSSPKIIGKVTISMEVCSNSGCAGAGNDRSRIQTSVSLRDYVGTLY